MHPEMACSLHLRYALTADTRGKTHEIFKSSIHTYRISVATRMLSAFQLFMQRLSLYTLVWV